jgi:hypothetical protein
MLPLGSPKSGRSKSVAAAVENILENISVAVISRAMLRVSSFCGENISIGQETYVIGQSSSQC